MGSRSVWCWAEVVPGVSPTWCVSRVLRKKCMLTSFQGVLRALEEDEIMFLDSVRERQELEERERKERDGEELKSFRE